MERAEILADRYRLVEPVATGTMGEVWRAVDTRLDREVAVKLLRAELTDEAARQRFAAEATVVAALSDARLAAVHDYGEHTDAEGVRPYLVLEWIDGRSLATVLAEAGRLSADETVRVVAEAAAALKVAHDAGIVHRDVKPGNILIADSGAVKLIDFGIATARGETGRDEADRILGTPTHLSPEQITDRPLSPGTDVYGLGVVAYECLTGAPPFDADNHTEILAAHLTQAPAPLPAEVPDALAEAVLRALRKRPAERWPDAEAFAAALRAALPVAEPEPEPEPLATPAPPPRRRLGFAPLLAATAVVALLAVAVVALLPSPESNADGRRAAAESHSDSPGASSATDEPTDAESSEAGKPGDPQTASASPTEAEDSESADGTGQQVPDLNGMAVYTVEYVLRQNGFDSSEGKALTEEPGVDNCVVVDQYPEAGATVNPSTTIVYGYHAPSYGCGLGARVSAVDAGATPPPPAASAPRSSRSGRAEAPPSPRRRR